MTGSGERHEDSYASAPLCRAGPNTVALIGSSVTEAPDVAEPRVEPNRAPANKGKRYPAEILTTDEVGALIRTCSPRAPTGIRNRALLVVLYRAGLRLSEALDLYAKDLDRRNGTLTVLHGKGDRRRTVGLDPGAFAIVERWIDKRREMGLHGRQRLFCTLRGSPIKSAYVRALLPRLARKAGIEKRVHAHALRHTHAAELMREGVPLNLIQRQLGHRSVATTSRYLDHLQPQEVVDAMQKRDWSL